MTTAATLYDGNVNGHALRLVDLLLGRRIGSTDVRPIELHGGASHTLTLNRYDGIPELPLGSIDGGPISHIIVHGSAATGDTCAFSDIDIAVIVDDTTVYSQHEHNRAMRALEGLLSTVFAFDPLMHHGLMFFPRTGLYAYDQRFLPIATLALGKLIYGPQRLTLYETPSPTAYFSDALRSCSLSLARTMERADFASDDFSLKQAISAALLMPARVLAAHGTHVYKRDSFTFAREYFDDPSWDLIARCEALRHAWKRVPTPALDRMLPARVHPYIRYAAHRRFSPRNNAQCLSRRMVQGLQRGARALLARVEALT